MINVSTIIEIWNVKGDGKIMSVNPNIAEMLCLLIYIKSHANKFRSSFS